MEGGRKRRGSSESGAGARRKRRTSEVNTQSAFRALASVLVVMAASAVAVAHHNMQRPEVRRSIYNTARLDWEEHADCCEGRGYFERMYRMPRRSFEKLALLLAPCLSVDPGFAGECGL